MPPHMRWYMVCAEVRGIGARLVCREWLWGLWFAPKAATALLWWVGGWGGGESPTVC